MSAKIQVKNFLTQLGFYPKDGSSGEFEKKYENHENYRIKINIEKEQIDWGESIRIDCKTTSNFSQEENFVVLECVNRLLEKGYSPKNLILEKTWPAGHGTSGRLDICVTRDDGSEYLLIECKTFGREFDKAVAQMHKDGGQLFTYFKFTDKADVIMYYTSELRGEEFIYKNEIVKIEDDYRTGGVKDFYDKWSKLTKDNGIFETWVEPYCFESKALIRSQLKPINQEDSSFIFNRFLEILRHNVVSDKGNAFNKIFTLFLCKVYDETSTEENEELAFQWKEGSDNHVKFQLRLTDLYKNGMKEFLSRTVSDFDDKEFERKYKTLDEDVKNELKDRINRLRLEKNNEFAIKEVYDHDSFVENAKIVKEVVELLQGYRIRYNKRQQYLSDFFELLLTTGLKQEAGQYFTPVPIAQFIIKSLPLEKIVDEKLKSKNGELLPYMIDYAAGSGHFITEYLHEIQSIIDKKDAKKYIDKTSKRIKNWQIDPYDWATEYVYGIEKDYRLVKVGKVGCYLHGDGLANVILSDGLGNFVKTKDYKGKLHKKNEDGSKDNQQFDILLSNPPYSVSAFRQTTRDYYTENDFELYDKLTDNSSEIECLFVERTKQLLKDGGVAGIILPSSILTNAGIYTKTRELLLKYFEIVAITELGSNTFMATGTSTIVLFLRRRNNYECINLEKSVDKIFSNHKDVTVNGIEKPVAKYVDYVWEGLSFNDYLTLLDQAPNDKVKSHDLFKEYKSKIKSKKDKEFWNEVIELEKEKIYYFILAYPQRLVIVKTGEKNAEKHFLGYEFSNRRGSEGIHPIQRNKSIDECTKLFDINSFGNPQKASTYIYKAFENDFDSGIDETLKDNISRVWLLDMLTFDRGIFEKNISLNPKKKEKIETKWDILELGNIENLVFEKGKSITKQETKEGHIPVIAGGTDFAYYHNTANRNSNVITVSASGANSGFVNFWDKPIWASDCSTIVSANEESIKIRYIYYFLKSRQKELFDLQKGNAQPHVYIKDIKKLKVPFPPISVQQKIVDEIEKIQFNIIKSKTIIDLNHRAINDLLLELYNSTNNRIRLSDADIFNLSIGKRVLNLELSKKNTIPVYSANTFEPFGYIDKLLINDFSKPSVIWGIDGDWMVNTIDKDVQFYPTDHCGVIRLQKKNLLEEKYLAFALGKEGTKIGFSRTKRASIDRISGITIPLPNYSDQKKTVAQIEKLEKRIAQAQSIIDDSKRQKQAILDKYLK